MFIPPPYYYKQFTTSKSFPVPDLDKVRQHTDDYYSFGEFYQFKDFEVDQIQVLKEKLAEKNIHGNLKLKLKELSKEIFDICLKIQDSIANVDNQHIELRQQLHENYEQFNLICQFINIKQVLIYLRLQKYIDLEEIFKIELLKLNQINKEMAVKIEEFQKQVSELNSDFITY